MTKPWQTQLRKLTQRKWRLRHGQAALEGVRLVEAALESEVPLVGVWYSGELLTRPGGERLLDRLHQVGVMPVEVAPSELDKVATVETNQGIIAIIDIRQPPLTGDGSLWVVVDGIQDPGNLGTLIRSAAAAAVDGIFLLPGTVDPYNAKTLRSAMGATFAVPLYPINSFAEQVVPYLEAQGAALVVADVHGDYAPVDLDFCRPVALVVGNEGWGPTAAVRTLAHHTVRIPMPGTTESLNVAMATTVLLYEVVRQRSLECPGPV